MITCWARLGGYAVMIFTSSLPMVDWLTLNLALEAGGCSEGSLTGGTGPLNQPSQYSKLPYLAPSPYLSSAGQARAKGVTMRTGGG